MFGKRRVRVQIEEGRSDSPERLLTEFVERRLDTAAAELREKALATPENWAVEQAFSDVMELRRVRQAVDALARRRTASVVEPLYLASASFLKTTFESLTVTPDEHLVYATGPEDGKQAFALTRLVTFELAEQSPVCAKPEPMSQLNALMELDRSGERLLAVLHSHPGNGEDATNASSDDLTTQEGLEKMGYPAIGAIFSRDGFVRFFSVNRPFRVAVSGTGVEKVGDRVYRVGNDAPLSIVRRVVCHATRS
jgi:hypothetical protein